MSVNKNILVIGARAGGYGAAIAKAAVSAGARVFGTTLSPDDPREQAFFDGLQTTLVEVPLRFHSDQRDRVRNELHAIEQWLQQRGISKLDAVVHTVAGGFPRQPSVMKAVGDILKGKQTFSDMATTVKRNVYYVNAGSFDETINGLSGITDESTHFVALTYRGDLPYFISSTKVSLERLALRQASRGKRTLIAALPESWTQSSQFFTGIEIAVINSYLKELRGRKTISGDLQSAFSSMETNLRALEGFEDLLAELQGFLNSDWQQVTRNSDLGALSAMVHDLFTRLRNNGKFPVLRKGVEIISEFVREASGILLVKEFISDNKFQSGEVKQIFFKDLLGGTEIETASPRESEIQVRKPTKKWIIFEKEEIRKTLSMYGKNFLFLDRVIMEDNEFYDGFTGFGKFTVPSPEENPILKDHFVGMPLFGGHLQMEAVAQLGTFMTLKLFKDKRLFPILTGTEFPDLNTMAPPGETLTIMGVIRFPEKRNLTLDAFIENRFARSKGIIRGMLLNVRLVKKMLGSFGSPESDD
jgi:3-hydroxymyristoyl/3-hydroxydecanoyl-(acyl carrier protein) dehydratase/nucleoside-diphosphate-sugar epimerase